MDRLEKRSKCLFCVEVLSESNADGEHVPFKNTKLFYNCAPTLCEVLGLPNFPFEYFFDNGGYCSSCRHKIEDLELAVQKIETLKETIASISDDIKIGVKSAYKTVFKTSKRTDFITLPLIKNGDREEAEELLKNKYTYRQVLKVIAEQIKKSNRGRKKICLDQAIVSESNDNGDQLDLDTSYQTPKTTSRKRVLKRPAGKSKTIVKQEPSVKVKRGRKGRPSLNPIVVLEKIKTGSTRPILKEDTSEKESVEKVGESCLPKLEHDENNWSTEDNDEIPEGATSPSVVSIAPSSTSTPSSSKRKVKTVRKRRPSNPNAPKKVKIDKPPVLMKCSVDACTETFNKKADLNVHIKDVHPGIKHNCDKCEKQYLNKKHLLDHQRTKHSGVSETFDCEICGIKFSYSKGLKAHRIRKHKDEYPDIYESYVQNKTGDPIPCVFENCPEIFALKMDLAAHIKEVHRGERRFECDDCGKRYINKKHLASHRSLKHSGLHPVVCDKCGKTFNFYRSLMKHIEMQHGEDHLLSCHVCSQTFEGETELEKHSAIHQDDIPFRCDICNTMFTNSRDLKHHVRSHSVKAAICDICGKCYSSQKNLKDHQLIHNDINTWPKCDVCLKPFKSARHLRKHMIVHSTENQYRCEICGEGFKYSSYLLKHNRRKHSMLRPFSCLICKKGFYETTQLKRHEEIHSGFKKYICDVCGKAFRTLQNHYQHYRTHNKDYQSQMIYKNLKRRALKSTRKRQIQKNKELYSKVDMNMDILDDSMEISPIIIECGSPMQDDHPGHLIPIPADEIHQYYEQGDTIVVVNDMEYHKFTF